MTRPGLDPELRELLADMPLQTELTAEMLTQLRQLPSTPVRTDAERQDVVLGDLADVPSHVSPAVATDLSGLPVTYIDTGTAEVFRDEDVDYATRTWAAGGQAELHTWAGGCHGFDAIYPDARLSVAARRTRTDWLARMLGQGQRRSVEEFAQDASPRRAACHPFQRSR